MAGGGPLSIWNEWATQILVLLSLTLQVVLLLFAGIRRRESSAVPTFLLWLAYLLADSTAIYALGHISLSSAPSKHQLVAFWAPFLLLHLGGPDNITAYSLEDSKLWPRHLQNLVVQVLGAAYVLYKYGASGDMYVLLAALLMFCVGVVKYGERTWALKCSNLDSIRSSLKKEPLGKYHHFRPPDHRSMIEAIKGDEFYVRRAHSMFHICKRAIVDSWVEKDHENQSVEMLRNIREEEDHEGMWTLMEFELSLLYDLLYTKAGVIHTWRGYCVRVASSLAAVSSFLLFQLSSKDGHSSVVDTAVTYTLLAGAFLLETASLLNALGSSWTYAFLCTTRWKWLRYAALCSGRWDRLRRLTKAMAGRGGSIVSARRWPGKIGQFNMLHFCSRRDSSRASIPLLGKVARMLGYKEWWIRYYYSGTIDITDDLKRRLFQYIKQLTRNGIALNLQGVIRMKWGQEALKTVDSELYKDLYKRFKDSKLLGVEFHEGVIMWHIATDIFIARSREGEAYLADDLVKAIRMLSNYMMFLLVDRPYMLPGLAQSMLYRRACGNLVDMGKDIPDRANGNLCTKIKDLFRLHDDPNFAGLMHVDELAYLKNWPEPSVTAPRLKFANEVAEIFRERQKEKGSKAVLELLLKVWIDFLVYAANRCSRESHAKKLSNGGELTTILWLMTDYLHQEGYGLEAA